MTTYSYPVLLFLSQAREQHRVFCGQLRRRTRALCLSHAIIFICGSNIQTYLKSPLLQQHRRIHSKKIKTDSSRRQSPRQSTDTHTVAFLILYRALGGRLKCHTDGFEAATSRIWEVAIISLLSDWSETDEVFWETGSTAHESKHPCQPGPSPVCTQRWQISPPHTHTHTQSPHTLSIRTVASANCSTSAQRSIQAHPWNRRWLTVKRHIARHISR